jgi:hypothetical protein
MYIMLRSRGRFIFIPTYKLSRSGVTLKRKFILTVNDNEATAKVMHSQMRNSVMISSEDM